MRLRTDFAPLRSIQPNAKHEPGETHMPAIRSVTPITKSKTTYQEIDGLLSGKAWADSIISYSFPLSNADYESTYGSGEPNKGFGAFDTPDEQNAFKKIFANFAAVTP